MLAASEKTAKDKLSKSYRNDFLAAIGDAEFAVLDNGQNLSLKTQSKKEHTVKASETRVLRPMK